MKNSVAENILKRDRIAVFSALTGVVALAWVYTVYQAGRMRDTGLEMMAVPDPQIWGAINVLLLFLMWAVMQAAMMTPTAAPMILMYAKINRQRQTQANPSLGAMMFLAGYLVVWAGFSALAALAQWGLHAAALLSPMMVSSNSALGGGLLIAAGVFQFTPLKHACLSHCRSPAGFFLTEWREGRRGALIMGLRHGGYCVACCWLIMALLFVTGVMNVIWMAVITVFMLLEKAAPVGERIGRIAGVLLIFWGVWMLF